MSGHPEGHTGVGPALGQIASYIVAICSALLLRAAKLLELDEWEEFIHIHRRSRSWPMAGPPAGQTQCRMLRRQEGRGCLLLRS